MQSSHALVLMLVGRRPSSESLVDERRRLPTHGRHGVTVVVRREKGITHREALPDLPRDLLGRERHVLTSVQHRYTLELVVQSADVLGLSGDTALGQASLELLRSFESLL